MRVMVIVKATKMSEAGEMPTEQLLTAMGKFNEELVKAGVMLAGGRPAPEHEGQAHSLWWRKTHGHRWPVRGDP